MTQFQAFIQHGKIRVFGQIGHSEAKAAEDSRTPRRCRDGLRATASARSWSAAVLCRFASKSRFCRPALIHLGLGLLFVSIAVGCKSTPKTPSNRLASVVIKSRTPDEIEAATRTIFEKYGYELSTRREGGAMMFERKGTFMNGLFYGDWYSGGVWERVKVYHIDMEPGATLLDCDAYMVQEHDDPFFQSERKPYKSRRHVYQKILEEVSKELGQK